LIQLFQNLIANAIKFKKENVNPIININCQSFDEYWEFSVTDNGIGFDKAYANRIFDIFQRLHTPQEYQGSGIGLSICQKIIRRHGGTISASSEPNQGSTFTFTISKSL
jgi:light-regulated signal transduction histidine kinase (bacteriophytochrome)